ncbi:MAG: isoprenylcysteine carboxylmethyltransferase family protein [Chloroflexi bacterium]|nr:isoprenylcysteine carboxylmethyltransferase family protein [Chloroflexota bacterium]
MKITPLLDNYASVKFLIGILIEFPILAGGGILGILFSWSRLPLYPLPNIFGLILIMAGYVVHLGYAHNAFKKQGVRAHHNPAGVNKLVTCGIYSRIRHPGYLGLILIYFGLALVFGIAWMLVPASTFTVLTYLTAIKEERFLLEHFGREYEEYRSRVPWRFIPKVI